jgi:hypothetical protein
MQPAYARYVSSTERRTARAVQPDLTSENARTRARARRLEHNAGTPTKASEVLVQICYGARVRTPPPGAFARRKPFRFAPLE